MNGTVGRHRPLAMGAVAFGLNMLLGVIYGWSMFVAPLEATFGWARAETSLVFTASMVCLCAGHLVSGALLPRTSPRFVLMAAAVLSGAGFALSAAGNSVGWFALSYGVCCGLAVGLGANCVLATALLWFPDRKGAASGLLLAGVGLGSLALGMPVTAVIDAMGWRVAFALLAVVFFAALGAGSFVLRRPGAAEAGGGTGSDGGRGPAMVGADSTAMASGVGSADSRAARSLTTAQMLCTGSFWLFFCWIVLMGTGGLALISNAVPAAADVVARSGAGSGALLFATTAMGLIGVANGVGRILSGWLWDRRGYRVALVAPPAAFAFAMVLCAGAEMWPHVGLVVAGFLLLGASYGASVAVGSALVGSFFGMGHYALNYAVASLNLLVASLIGPAVAAASWDGTDSYLAAYLVLAALALAALLLAALIRPPKGSTPLPR